jgi:prepilin-type N-terminal cleavage/methylation domain-containing protein
MKRRGGFTLIELIVVIAILAILAAIAIPSVAGMTDRAKLSADKGTIATLNSVTPVFRISAGQSDPFKEEISKSGELMQCLVDEGYLSEVVLPQTKNATFTWDFANQSWRLYVAETPVSLTPLGSTFEEISPAMISLIIKKFESSGKYGRNWGDYSYTDLGLDPADWQAPVMHIYYKPGGSNLRIRPEEGYDLIVMDMLGNPKTLKSSYNWDLIYSDVNKKWYFHTISDENAIDITTLKLSS